jgi:signal transduction histidine kinase
MDINFNNAKIQNLIEKQPSSILLSLFTIPILLFPYFFREDSILQKGLLTWIILTLFFLMLRFILIQKFKIELKKCDSLSSAAERSYAVTLFLYGLSYSSILFIINNQEISKDMIFVTYLVLIAIVSGAITRTTSSLISSLAIILGFSLNLILSQLLQPEIKIEQPLAFFIYSVYLFSSAKQNFTQFKNTFLLLKERESHITELNKILTLEEELKEQKTMTYHLEKMATLGEMAGNIAHEINNPLMVIQGNTQLIEKKLNDVTFKKNFQSIYTTINRITDIITNLKGFSRQSNNEQLDMFDLKTVFEELYSLSGEKIKTKGISFKLTNSKSIFVIGKHSGLLQVLLNLINNAVHAVEKLDDRSIFIETKITGSNCIILIKDSGKGIPLSLRDKIFKPYFSTKSAIEGTGLGLSISKKLIQDMNGDLYLLENSKNEFHIKLNLYKENKNILETKKAS